MQFLWTTTEQGAYSILDTYYELGGSIIDTADVYTNWVPGLHGGEAETIIGKWLKKRNNRDKIFLISKVRARVWEEADGEGLTRQHILKAIDKTLQRLQTDYLDVYISHWSDANTPIEETLLAYQELIKQGKVRTIGCSNYTKENLQEALIMGSDLGVTYTCLQAYYNLLDRKQFEKNLLPLIKKYNLTVCIYGSLASGFLTGAYKKDKQLPRNARAQFVKSKMTQENFKKLNSIAMLGRKYHATISQISLAWLIQKGYMPIIGADAPGHVLENMKARKIILTKDDMDFLDNLI